VPLLKPSSAFEEVAAKRSFSLHLSVMGRIPAFFGAALILAVFGFTKGWIFVIGGLALAAVVGSVTTTRRIDIDRDGLTFVPLLPGMPTQRVSFGARTPPTGLVGVFRRGEVVIGPSFKADFTDAPLPPTELKDLLERIRNTPAHQVHVDPSLIVPEGKLRRKENLVIGVGTVITIIVIGIVLALIHG